MRVTLTTALVLAGGCAIIDGSTNGQGIFGRCDTQDDCGVFDVCTAQGCMDPEDFGGGDSCIDDADCNGVSSIDAHCPLGATLCRCLENCAYTFGFACNDNDGCPGGFCAGEERTCFSYFDCSIDDDCSSGICSPDLRCEREENADFCSTSTSCAVGVCINNGCYTDSGAPCDTHADCPNFTDHCWGATQTCVVEVPR
jgi:hypothetical protein